MATKSDNVLDELFQSPKEEISLNKPVEQKGFLTAQEWLDKRESEITRILSTLLPSKQMTVGDPTANLSAMHTVITNIREQQAFIGTYLARVIEMELEVKRALAAITSQYKDEMGRALVEFKDLVANSRGLEERELRLRDKLPVLKRKEEWESTLENIKLLRQAVELMYEDLSKAAMAINLQGQVLRNQILIGEVKLVNNNLIRLFQDSTLEAVEKANVNNMVRGTSQI